MIASPALLLALDFSTSTLVLSFAAGLVCALLGGAALGIKLAGKDIGNEMAGMMGALYGATHAIPAIILGLIILYFI